jgi:MraZ protein
MFRGNHPTRVDEKGRLKLPAEFKRVLEGKYGPFEEASPAVFFITSKDGKVIEIYPMKEWEKIEVIMAGIPDSNPAKKKLLHLVNYYGGVAEMDGQGRILIPQLLREAAKAIGDVVVLGMQTYLQAVNHDDFKASMDAAPLTEADEAALAALGL